MADEFAIVVLDAPLAIGDQDFTDPEITDFTAAVVLISGDYLTEASSAQLTYAHFTKDRGSSTSHQYLAAFSRAGASGIGFSRHIPSTQTSGTGGIRVLDPATNGGNWGLGTISDLSNGFRVNWTDVSGFSSGRRVKLIALLFGKTTIHAGFGNENLAFMSGLSPVQMLAATKRGGFGSTNTDMSLGIGGAVDGAPIKQALAMVNWPSAADPITAAVYASASKYGGRINSSGGVPTTVDVQAVTDFLTDGFDRDSNTVGGMFLGFPWIDNRQGFVELVTLSGSESGSTLLLNLGRHVEIVLGVFVGCTSNDSLDTSANAQEVGLFLFDGLGEAHSISLAIDEGLDPDTSPTVGFSRYKANEWNVVSGSGGTAWRVTGLLSTEEGLRGTVVTAKAGRLFLWGVSRIPALAPTPIALPLVMPAPTVLAERTEMPPPLEVALVLPTPALVFPMVVPALELALVLPAPSVFAPPVLVPEPPPPDLGPLHAETLAALLPRGLAWARRPLPS